MQAAPEFYPDILLRKLTVRHTQVVQGDGDYYTDDGKALQLKGTEVSFALSFVVPDFLSGEDIEYSYQLEGYDKDWTSFSSINEASYTGVPAGDYILRYAIRGMYLIQNIGIFLFRYISFLPGIDRWRLILFI